MWVGDSFFKFIYGCYEGGMKYLRSAECWKNSFSLQNWFLIRVFVDMNEKNSNIRQVTCVRFLIDLEQ